MHLEIPSFLTHCIFIFVFSNFSSCPTYSNWLIATAFINNTPMYSNADHIPPPPTLQIYGHRRQQIISGGYKNLHGRVKGLMILKLQEKRARSLSHPSSQAPAPSPNGPATLTWRCSDVEAERPPFPARLAHFVFVPLGLNDFCLYSLDPSRPSLCHPLFFMWRGGEAGAVRFASTASWTVRRIIR